MQKTQEEIREQIQQKSNIIEQQKARLKDLEEVQQEIPTPTRYFEIKKLRQQLSTRYSLNNNNER